MRMGVARLDRRPFLFAYGDGSRPGDSRGDDLLVLVSTPYNDSQMLVSTSHAVTAAMRQGTL